MRPTVMEVNLNNFRYNIESIRNYANGKEIMPVVKANGYGTYINKRLDILNEFNIVAVATCSEAIELRNIGYDKYIFVLNQPYIDEIDSIIQNDISFGISSIEFLNQILDFEKTIRVHLEIETGMNRTGIDIDNLEMFINKIKTNSNIIVEGVYTHLSSADNDYDYTNRQIEMFKRAICIAQENFSFIKYVHAEASNGILNYNLSFTNLVRPGLIIYGYESFDGVYDLIDIKPVCRLKSKITFIKEVNDGEYIGYSKKYKINGKSIIATVPIGYADGVSRRLSNNGYVVVNGKKASIVGNVCMDSIMIDVTNISNVSIGSDVFIWDNDVLKLDDVARLCDTINYEIISCISDRVLRKFI